MLVSVSEEDAGKIGNWRLKRSVSNSYEWRQRIIKINNAIYFMVFDGYYIYNLHINKL